MKELKPNYRAWTGGAWPNCTLPAAFSVSSGSAVCFSASPSEPLCPQLPHKQEVSGIKCSADRRQILSEGQQLQIMVDSSVLTPILSWSTSSNAINHRTCLGFPGSPSCDVHMRLMFSSTSVKSWCPDLKRWLTSNLRIHSPKALAKWKEGCWEAFSPFTPSDSVGRIMVHRSAESSVKGLAC